MGKAAIIQVLCADAPGRQACRWRAPAEGNIKGFPDELDISAIACPTLPNIENKPVGFLLLLDLFNLTLL